MRYSVKLLPIARQDIRESIKWYNKQKPGLGKLFYASVKFRIAYLHENPLHYQIGYRDIRHANIDTFPYQVHYKVEEDKKTVIVFGVMHTSRNPEVWKDRS